jgi:hypothetical protein
MFSDISDEELPRETTSTIPSEAPTLSDEEIIFFVMNIEEPSLRRYT